MSYLQEQAKLQSDYQRDQLRAGDLRAHLLNIIDRTGYAEVTDEVFPTLFPVEPELTQVLLAGGGHRPPETRDEQIKRFCEERRLEYRCDRGSGFSERHYFRRRRDQTDAPLVHLS